MSKIIAHIDMNCFYASVEEKYNPSLQGKPLAVAGSIKDRHGIIITSNYVARSYGVKTTMRIGEARKLCPNVTIMKPTFERYQEQSQLVFDLIKEYTQNVEIVSIDEAYIDLTEIVEPIKTMAIIQRRIYDELQLPSSVGLSYNKFFAKMASDMKKPKGFTIINKKNYKELLWNLDVGEMHGCGSSAEKKLKKIGINTIGDIAVANDVVLNSILGIQGLRLKHRANGNDDRKLKYKVERKSIGNSKTYPKDLEDEAEILKEIKNLSNKVSERAKNKNYVGNNISITIKYNDFKVLTRAKKILYYTNLQDEINQVASELILENYNIDKGVRLLGVSLNDIKKISEITEQLDIFDNSSSENEAKIRRALREINKKYNKEAVFEIRETNNKNIITTSFSKDFLDD